MTDWRPQHFIKSAPDGLGQGVLAAAVETAKITNSVNNSLPPVFSLRHLAHYTSIDYKILRSVVSRSEVESYRTFVIHKRPACPGKQRYRRISVPSEPLMMVQRWVNKRILQRCTPDEASVAFQEDCKVREAAELHCKSRWLIKVDVVDFFDSINEISVYRVFHGIGYQPRRS